MKDERKCNIVKQFNDALKLYKQLITINAAN